MKAKQKYITIVFAVTMLIIVVLVIIGSSSEKTTEQKKEKGTFTMELSSSKVKNNKK